MNEGEAKTKIRVEMPRKGEFVGLKAKSAEAHQEPAEYLAALLGRSRTVAATATELQVTTATVYRMIHHYGIEIVRGD
jgi:hypothetical protein